MARFILPIEQVLKSDASGVGASWTLTFYSTGTTTAKDTYSDSALTTANANPVVADSAGRFGDIFMGSGTYRVILKDSDGTTIWDADPVDGALGASGAVAAKTAAYTVTIDDATKIIAVDASSGAVTITLLAAATAGDGFEITVKKTDSSSNAVTIDGDGSETIDGATTLVLDSQYASASLRSDASNWHILSGSLVKLVTTRGDIVRGSSNGRIERLALGATGTVPSSDGTDIAYARAPLKNYIEGLVLSNDTDSDHDILIAVGAARDTTNAVSMELTTAITKQIDATWASGDDAGGMNDNDTVDNNELFYVHLLSSADGATVDAGFDTSATATNLLADTAVVAAGLTKYRPIGFVVTNGSANIIAFTQVGDYFRLTGDVVNDVTDSTITGGTFEAATLSVPPNCLAHLYGRVDNATASGAEGLAIRTAGAADVATSVEAWIWIQSGTFDTACAIGMVLTDGSGQVEYTAAEATGDATVYISTLGCLMLTRSNPV